MRSAAPHKAKNRSILKTISANFPVIAALTPQIWSTYLAYYPAKGNPTAINPLILPIADATNLAAVMKDCYASDRKRDGLGWLFSYRLRHGYSHCPMCGAAHPKSLDHFLPQDHYPEFAVFSLNLVPSCMSCNGHRSSTANQPNAALPMLHPFFDGEYLDVEFLFATNSGTYEAPNFSPLARHPDANIQDRVAEHVRRSVDVDLFNTWLTGLLTEAQGIASRYSTDVLLTQEIEHRLRDEVRLIGPNTWEAAFLRWIKADPNAIAWLVDNPL